MPPPMSGADPGTAGPNGWPDSSGGLAFSARPAGNLHGPSGPARGAHRGAATAGTGHMLVILIKCIHEMPYGGFVTMPTVFHRYRLS